ncbi:MAG: hypothetical protein IPN33_08730 [Saprospiraceae bacterium]|nr:hypothetical protein [Saprospiraceae bacterium]
MYKYLSKNGQLIAFGTGAFLVILFVISWLSGYSELQAMPEEEQVKTGIFDIGLLGSFFLFLVAVVASAGFGLTQIASNFKSSIRGLLGVLALVVLFVVAYVTSTPDSHAIVAAAADKMNVSDSTQKLIGAGLTTMVVIAVTTLVAFVYGEIRNFFK